MNHNFRTEDMPNRMLQMQYHPIHELSAGADIHTHKMNESILTHLVQQQGSNSLHLKWKTCCMSRVRRVGLG